MRLQGGGQPESDLPDRMCKINGLGCKSGERGRGNPCSSESNTPRTGSQVFTFRKAPIHLVVVVSIALVVPVL